MTRFSSFDHLTWPEVRSLSREIPLVLPLGLYQNEKIAHAMGQPDQIGMLPAIPYGWKGSACEVPQHVFRRVVHNLIKNLWEDGFTNVVVVTPLDLKLGINQQVIPHEEFPPFAFPANIASRVVLVPVGQIEQHALHLPLLVDTACITAVTQGVSAVLPDLTLTLPVFPYGVSTHRRSFAGTFNVGGRTFEDFFLGVVNTLTRKGAEMIYLLSGHGGNVSFLSTVVKYAGEQHPSSFIATSWLYLSGPSGMAALDERRDSGIGGMGHACELETSLMLHLHPELVQMERVVDEVDFISSPSYYQDWVEGGALIANPPWEDDTTTGAYGAGSLATAEKGAFWLKAAVDEKVAHVHEIIEQQQRRIRKRTAS